MKIGSKENNRLKIQNHIAEFTNWFNEAAALHDLGVRLDAAEVMDSVKVLNGARLRDMFVAMENHRLHKEQVMTAVEVIKNTIDNPGSSGLVIGALQSGKTGTAFTTLFAAPIHYLKSKVSYVPMFLTTNQNSHLQQTQDALRAFFGLYGDISIQSDGRTHSLIDYYAESGAELSEADDTTEISLHEYTTTLVDDIYDGQDIVRALVEGMTVKRQNKDINTKIRQLCERAKKSGHGVMLIVDEPQYGASDRIKNDGNSVKCLLNRVLEEIDEEFFSSLTPNFMVGLSATPFDSVRISNLFQVRQRLNEEYVGPNFFDGSAIDPKVKNKTPKVISFGEVAKSAHFQDFSELSYLIGNSDNPKRKTFKALKILPDGSKAQMSAFERYQYGSRLVRSLMDNLLKTKTANHPGEKLGALIRISNSTRNTEDVLNAMGLDGADSPYNVIRFYNNDGDVKRLVREKTKNDPRPYIVVTIGKGRMGDAFPSSCCIAMDLTNRSSDANAFLQGVFGRMCGYGKKAPVVVVSDYNADLWNEYKENFGSMSNFKSSRHTIDRLIYKGKNKKIKYFKVTNEMIDNEPVESPLRSLREGLVSYLEDQELSKPNSNEHVPHRKSKDTHVNLPEMAEKFGVLDYIREKGSFINPLIRGNVEIVPFNEQIEYESKKDGTSLIGYSMSDEGRKCHVLVTKNDLTNENTKHNSERALGRAQSQNYADAKMQGHQSIGRQHGTIVPVITVKKVDNNGKAIPSTEFGRYVFDSIVFHLKSEVRVFQPTISDRSPVIGHAFSDAMTDQEKAVQFGAYLASQMYKGRKQLTILEAMGTDQVQRVLGQIYDRQTHTYEVDGDTITFVDLETGLVDNRKGPAIIYLNDFRNIIGETVVEDPEFEDDLESALEMTRGL